METRKLFNRLKKSQSKYSSYKQIGFIKDYILNDYEWIAFKSVKNQSRMNGVEFMNKYNKGIYILRMAHHCTVCIDGDILDTWDCTDKCVYGAWKIS